MSNLKTVKMLPHLLPIRTAKMMELRSQTRLPMAESFRRRCGVNAPKVLSNYRNSNWDNWPRESRNLFKSLLPATFVERSVLGYFLHLPNEEGFLDRMETWVGKPHAGVIVAYALGSEQVILINDEEYRVPYGSGIMFSLSNPHEIKQSPYGQDWACLMLPGAAVSDEEWRTQ